MKPYLHSALRFRAISSAKRILGSVRDSSVSVPYADYTIMPSFRPQQNICDTNGLSAQMNGNRPIPHPAWSRKQRISVPASAYPHEASRPLPDGVSSKHKKAAARLCRNRQLPVHCLPICRPITPTISGLRSHSNCYLLLYHISASSLPSSTAGIYLRRIHSIGHDIRYRYTPGITSKRTGA